MSENPEPKICPLLTIATSIKPTIIPSQTNTFQPCIQDKCEWWVEKAGCEFTFLGALHDAIDDLQNRLR